MKLYLALGIVVLPAAGLAQVNIIGPFSGTLHEGYETQPSATYSSISVFGGAGTVNQAGSGASLLVTTGWSFFSLVTPHGGGQFMGGAGVNYSYTFSTAATQFGGYFATNADSAGAVATFFDANNAQIGSSVAMSVPMGQWAWNGWQYAGGIKRVDIVASNQFGGFIMSDDLELITTAPEPASMAVLGIGLAVLARRRRAKKSA